MPAAAAALRVVAETAAELGERIRARPAGRAALLVLDGFERFLADAAQVAQRARRRAEPDRAGHEPRAAAADRRARLPRAAARRLQRRRAVSRAREGAAPGLGAGRRRRRGHGDLRAPGRASAGDRAGRRPRAAAPAALAAAAPAASPGPAQLRPARPAAAPAVAARDARVVLGCAHAAPALAARAHERLRGRRDARGLPRRLQPRGRIDRAGSGRHHGPQLADGVEAGEEGQPRLSMLDTVREFAAGQGDDLAAFEAGTRSTSCLRRARGRAGRPRRPARVGRAAGGERGNLRVAFERLLRAGAVRGRAADRDRLRARSAVGRARRRGPRLAQRSAPVAPPSPRRATALYWDGAARPVASAVRRGQAPLDRRWRPHRRCRTTSCRPRR